MADQPLESLTLKQTKLSTRITAIVFWGLAITGVLAAMVVSNGLEHKIADERERASIFATHETERYVKLHPKLNDNSIHIILSQIRKKYGFPAVGLESDGYQIEIGEHGYGYPKISDSFEIYNNAGKAKLRTVEMLFYFTPIEKTTAAQRNNILLGMGLFFLAFGAILNIILQRILTRPFSQMVVVAKHFSEGDHEVRFETNQDNEFGYLGRFINQIIDQLTNNQDSLKAALARVWHSEAELFKEKELAEVTLHSIGDAVVTANSLRQIEYMNPTAERLTGWSKEDVYGKPVDDVLKLINEESRESIANPISKTLDSGEGLGLSEDIILIRKDGDELAIANTAAPIRDKQGAVVGAVMVFHDIEQTRRLTRQLNYQASHDSLTGLYNRRAFERELDHVLDIVAMGSSSHALCFLDLDQFKIVNDTCGHTAGDEMLRQLANLLQRELRESDVLARLGGDEFAVLLTHCDMPTAVQVAEKLRFAIEEYRFAWEDHVFESGVSIGVAPISADNNNIHEVMTMADVACYAAKDRGRNRIHEYRLDDNELIQRRGEMQWVNRIKKALEEDRFELYYQTIAPISSETESSIHFEILVRMIDEQGSIVPPSTFIPSAERYDLMPSIDRWVIKNTFDFLRSDLCKDIQCICAINLSGQSLCDERFVDYLKEKLSGIDIVANKICFEITETAAIANLSKAMQFVESMRELGCKFALDDFGSGLSSFGYLKNLAVDYLKIDGSFVKDMVDDPIDHAMVEAVNRIGHIMNIQTIAEFVESAEILKALQALGVDYAQGYAIAKPEPLRLIPGHMEKNMKLPCNTIV